MRISASRRVASVLAAAALAVYAGAPVHAQPADGPPAPFYAAVNGWARGAALFVPAAVNPNLDFWPVYSFSEMDNTLSHGVSAGFWPGFLVDATFFQFGYQPFERALFGVAESLWPNPPQDDSASSADFEEMCVAGGRARIALPAHLGEAGFPDPPLSACRSLYSQYRNDIPYEISSGRTTSGERAASGRARGARLVAGSGATIGAAAVTSSTRQQESAVVSESTVLLSDVSIGESLFIRQIRAIARAVADGTARGTTAERHFIISGVTFNGEDATIDESGVSVPGTGSVDEELRRQGFDVRLFPGETASSDGTARAGSGGLVVRLTRGGTPPHVGPAAQAACDQIARNQPGEIAEVDRSGGANPLAGDSFPYDQLPPELRVNQSVPPAIPCLLLLFERSVDTGMVLGGAAASARLLPLPSPPAFDGGVFVPDRVLHQVVRSGGGAFGPGFDAGATIPSLEDVPPVPLDRIRPQAAGLGAEEAEKVRMIYGMMALALAALVGGRRGFRALVRG